MPKNALFFQKNCIPDPKIKKIWVGPFLRESGSNPSIWYPTNFFRISSV